jgi:hypothetical protein
MMKHLIALSIWLALVPSIVQADQTEAEIDFLLTTIGHSDCVFVRNGKEYDAEDAEAHLRMKYKRGKRYAPTTEKFIERLASQSSMSKKPYFIECANDGRVPSGQWLTNLLNEYRSGNPS